MSTGRVEGDIASLLTLPCNFSSIKLYRSCNRLLPKTADSSYRTKARRQVLKHEPTLHKQAGTNIHITQKGEINEVENKN